MSASRKLVYSGLAMLVCASGAGCAGSRLRDMFASGSPSDYKTLQEIAEDERRQTEGSSSSAVAGTETTADKPALGTRLSSWSPMKKNTPAAEESAGSAVADTKAAEASGDTKLPNPFDSLLARGNRRKELEADPFLERPGTETAKKSAKVQSEAERLAELDALAASKSEKVTQKTSTGKTTADKALADKPLGGKPVADQLADTKSAEKKTVRNTAAAKAPVSKKAAENPFENEELLAALDPEGQADSAAEPLIQSKKKPSHSTGNPAADLEALVSRHNASRGESAGVRKASAVTVEDSVDKEDSGEDYQEMFRALQADFETSAEESSRENAVALSDKKAGRSGTQARDFDALLSGDSQATASAARRVRKITPVNGQVVQETSQEKSADFGKTAKSAGRLSKTVLAANQLLVQADKSQTGNAELFDGKDPFAQVGLADVKAHADQEGFQWKQASDAEETLRQASLTSAEATGFAASETPEKSGSESEDSWGSGFAKNSHRTVSDDSSFAAFASSQDRSGAVAPTRTVSMSRNPGFEDDPFQSASFHTGLETTPGPVAAVDGTPVVKLGGPLTRISMRTWGLIFGGIIVAILLFAPRRNKPVHAER